MAQGAAKKPGTDHGLLLGLSDDDHSAYPKYTEYQDWTPAWTNFTVGNGTLNYARYVHMGKLVHGYVKFTLGSTSSVDGDTLTDMPVGPNTIYDSLDTPIGKAIFQDAAGARMWGTITITSDTLLSIRVGGVSSTYLTEANLSSTIPFTWANTDMISFDFMYEAASAV